MKRITYLTPGPSELYFTVDFHLKNALKTGVGSINHRSRDFEKIYLSLKENLKLMFDMPDDFQFFFTSSATEVWDRMAENLIIEDSFHMIGGAFAQKFYEAVGNCGKSPLSMTTVDNQPFDLSGLMISENNELIAITQNETSTGTRFPQEDILQIRQSFPDQILAVDAVSSAPVEPLDFGQFDTMYLSVQKCFGLPAGLGLWFVNDRCIEKAYELQQNGLLRNSFHSIPRFVEMTSKNQTPSTPNILNIYLLDKVVQDMLNKGLDMIRREMDYKSVLLYQCLENHPAFNVFVKEEKIRSKTVAVATCPNPELWDEYLVSKGFKIGPGYGKYKGTHLRFANFPTHSKEQIELLVDILNDTPEVPVQKLEKT